MKSKISGFIIWVINNASLIAMIDSLICLIKEETTASIARLILFGIMWLDTGTSIVCTYVEANRTKEQSGEPEQ